MADKPTITIRLGEKQLSNTAAVKTYFSGRTITGLDVPMGKVSGLVRQWSRTGEDIESVFPSRSTVISYSVISTCVLKMFSIYTSIGSRKAYAEVLLKVSKKAPRISVSGYHGFGEFIGNAYVLTDKDSIPAEIQIRTLAPGMDSEDQTTGLIF